MKNTEQYLILNCSHIGASHIASGLPCQDASLSCSYKDTNIAIVSDGHGNRRHFRSDSGSKIACEVALEEIKKYIDTNISIDELKHNICSEWKNNVKLDLENHPLTESESEEQKRILSEDEYKNLVDEKNTHIAYGCTLICVFSNEAGYTALQVGDGAFVVVSPEGFYSWPMPESRFNDGNKTFSLCATDPMLDFRHVESKDSPTALFVYTDGIEKTYPNEEKEAISLLYWIVSECRSERTDIDDVLYTTLGNITNNSAIGDDISIAGIINKQGIIAQPRLYAVQIKHEYATLEAQLNEIINTIDYNTTRINDLKHQQNSDCDAINQMESILERKKLEYKLLMQKISEIDQRYRLAKQDEIEILNANNRPIFEVWEDTESGIDCSGIDVKSETAIKSDAFVENSRGLYRIEKRNVLGYIRCFGPNNGYVYLNGDCLCISKRPLIRVPFLIRKNHIADNTILVLKREDITSCKEANVYKRKMLWRVIGFKNRELALSASPDVLSKIDTWVNSSFDGKENSL